MEATLEKQNVSELIAESKRLVEQAKSFLVSEGKVLEIGKYLTIKNYCKKYNIKEESVVTNWIRRGIVSQEDVHTFEDLNGLRMIKDKLYR
jgi:S-methylmethionine-dependent homocysteine/selenocysteine methylase